MANENINILPWEMEIDPLEIKEELNLEEEIDVKDEPTEFEYYDGIHLQNETQVSIDKVPKWEREDSDDIPLYDGLKYLDVQKSTNRLQIQSAIVNEVRNYRKTITFNSKIIKLVPSSIVSAPREPETSMILDIGSTTVNNLIRKDKLCDCMKNVEYYCIKCNNASIYLKEIKYCTTCKTLFKLQCKLCNKKYRVLNKVQPVLQINKVINSSSMQKELSTMDIENKTTDDRSKNVAILNIENTITKNKKKSVSTYQNHFKKKRPANSKNNNTNESEEHLFCCPKCDFKTTRKGILGIHIEKSHRYVTILNPDEDDDMYIELICEYCKLTLKKVSYEDKIRYFCTNGCLKPMIYKCILCPKTCKLLRNIRYHVRCICYFRINREKIKCAHCPYKTEIKSRLEFHIWTNHTPKFCQNCNFEFINNEALNRHLESGCAPKSSYKVTSIKSAGNVAESKEPINCYSKKILKLSLYNHKVIENSPEDLVRDMKPTLAKNLSAENWSSDVDYFCLECGEETKKKFSKYRPWCRKCKIKFDYRCISCGKMYSSYSRIYKHVNNECHARFVYHCPFCEYTGSKKNLLCNHIRCRHAIYRCFQCNNDCEGFLALKKHIAWACLMENVYGEIRYKNLVSLYCKECNKCFESSNDGSLIQCERCLVQTSYQCKKCFAQFDNRDLMKSHVRECKPNFQCKSCEFITYTKQDFDIHLKQKHIVRRCPECRASFTDEKVFRIHRLQEMQKKVEKNNDCEDHGGASAYNIQYITRQ